MKVLEKIFSVKNSENRSHKVFTILGLKFKFKLKDSNIINILLENNKLIRKNQRLLNKIEKRMYMLDIPLDYKKFWINDDLQNIIPLNWGKYPEGFNPGEVISKEILKDIPYNTIVDFGCGYGRLSENFNPKKYIGIDLNSKALEKAKENNPEYNYLEINIDSEYPKCDIVFAYTVFLHNDDKTLKSILCRLKNTNCKYIMIADIMSKNWPENIIPPTYHRSVEEYNTLMSDIGFSLILEKRYPYKRYAESAEFNHLNTDMSFLLYKQD